MSEILTKVDKLIYDKNLICDGDFVVLGVSGGADSMLLLSYFISIREKHSLRLLVANVEHGIRGQESIDDTEFVKNYCKEHNVEFKSISINAEQEAKQKGMSVEEYSREVRYNFFHSFNPDKIATAHNLSDNVETVLFRLSRGTSIKGMCGIPVKRGNIIRPLLILSSKEIRDYCNQRGIPYRIDSTNNDIKYTRNFVRGQIVPLFEQINPSFQGAVSRFITSVSEDEDFIECSSNECFDNCFKKDHLIISRLKEYHIAVQKRAIIKYFDMYGLTLDDCHLSNVVRLLGVPGREQISNNYYAISDKKRLRIAVFNESVSVNDLTINKKIISRKEFLNNCELLRKEFDFYCDYDKIQGDVIFRTRDEGDKISPAGRDCTKTLKKLYNEYQIDVEIRDSIPVVCDDLGIIGIYGYCCDERVKIDNTTSSVILIKIYSED